jgi:hypothetical protein
VIVRIRLTPISMNPLPPLSTFLQTEGGRTCVCLALIAFYPILYHWQVPKADDVFVFAMGVLAREMGSNVLGQAAKPSALPAAPAPPQ